MNRRCNDYNIIKVNRILLVVFPVSSEAKDSGLLLFEGECKHQGKSFPSRVPIRWWFGAAEMGT